VTQFERHSGNLARPGIQVSTALASQLESILREIEGRV